MTLKQFKEEFRLTCVDTWGNAMDAHFEAVGHLHKRKLKINPSREYHPGAGGNGTDKDCYWYELFVNLPTKQLRKIEEFLFRYCSYLRFKGINY